MNDLNSYVAGLKAACEQLHAADLPNEGGYREDIADMLDGVLTLESRLHAMLRLSPENYPPGILHDLRSPLNVIIGYAQMLADDSTLATAIRQTATCVYQDGDKLANAFSAIFGNLPTGDDIIQ